MLSELTCLKLSILLWVAHVVVQAAFGNLQLPFGYLFTSRDKAPQPTGLAFGRATRALHNYVENYGPFLAADLGLIATGHTGGYGATVWILARIVYLPIYVMGIDYARTAIWAISIVGILMMLSRLAGA
jgi:uncharacterized MAPEG superfamily protein